MKTKQKAFNFLSKPEASRIFFLFLIVIVTSCAPRLAKNGAFTYSPVCHGRNFAQVVVRRHSFSVVSLLFFRSPELYLKIRHYSLVHFFWFSQFGIAFCLFINYAYIRTWTVQCETSRGLNWENKTYKRIRRIAAFTSVDTCEKISLAGPLSVQFL